ncbi:MAG: hypothetical protein DI607_12890 [Sphingomonas hengshuiensis]|nr:MAG: hypothetical protein DI607_12890 [Sphingomonas hengshuiensis]
MFKVLIANGLTDTLPLKADQVAAKLANLQAPNAYIDSLIDGAPVGIDSADGCAIVTEGTGTSIGLIVNGSLANAAANYHGLANKQITYVCGPALVETDVVKGGIAYNPGDKLYAGIGADKGVLTKDGTGNTDRILGIVKRGRTSGSTAPLTVIML